MNTYLLNYLKSKKEELENEGLIVTADILIAEIENDLEEELKKDLKGIDPHDN